VGAAKLGFIEGARGGGGAAAGRGGREGELGGGRGTSKESRWIHDGGAAVPAVCQSPARQRRGEADGSW
jgi:hypothetical protein